MKHLFIDESGDLGFSKGSSKWFLFTILLTGKHRKVEKVIKKTHKGLRKKYKNVMELHAYNVKPVTRKRVLKGLAEIDDLQVVCVLLNKEKVYVDLQQQNNYLYNYTANILLDRFHSKRITNATDIIRICIDQKYTNKHLKTNFINYLTNQTLHWPQENIDITTRTSHAEKCLQATDFISWAIFRKYEMGDYEYYELIKDKIVEENILFP
jgi:hypothetical protein